MSLAAATEPHLDAADLTELHFAGDRDRCLALCADAETIARGADDTDALAAVFSAQHYALYGAPDVQERLALVTESAFDENPRARVTFAELRARTEFDASSVPALVA